MSFWGSLASAGAAVFGTMQSNKNIDKQISAQSKENEKIRKYNLDLAKKQNEWNLRQWQMENAYNSPSAQIERMREAGLNPDMMYGGGVSGNLSASSPSMTSGAAATPMDFSSLANKKTVGDAIMQTLAIEQARANIDKTRSETKGQDISNDFAPLEKAMGIELSQSQIDVNNATVKQISADIERLGALTVNLQQDTVNKALDYVFKNKSMQYEIRKLAAEAEISEKELEYVQKTLLARVAYQGAVTDKAKAEAEEASYKATIAKFEKNSFWFNKFLDVWDKGIKTFETFLEFRGFVDTTEEYFDRDGDGNVLSKSTKKTHSH